MPETISNDATSAITVPIASDHGGFELKEFFKSLSDSQIKWNDLGPSNNNRVDYPDFADLVCKEVLESNGKKMGVLICGSGQGMALRANKYLGIRAALCWNTESAILARQHNDANILCLGARLIDPDECMKILQTFVSTEFEGERHIKRVEKVSLSVEYPTKTTDSKA